MIRLIHNKARIFMQLIGSTKVLELSSDHWQYMNYNKERFLNDLYIVLAPLQSFFNLQSLLLGSSHNVQNSPVKKCNPVMNTLS